MPVPDEPLLAAVRAMSSRPRDCAISHSVDAAAASRAPVISRRVSVTGLAEHVAAAMRARVASEVCTCQREEPAWLAPAYQWVHVLDALGAIDPATAGGPHPRTTEWQRSYARAVIGDSRAAQAATVRRWLEADQRDTDAVRAVAFGVSKPSEIERLVGAGATEDDFDRYLPASLVEFVECRWPLLYLYTVKEEKRE